MGGGDDVFIWLKWGLIVESIGVIVYNWGGVQRGLGPCWYFSHCMIKLKLNSLRIGFKELSCRQKGVIRAAQRLLFCLAARENLIVE